MGRSRPPHAAKGAQTVLASCPKHLAAEWMPANLHGRPYSHGSGAGLYLSVHVG